MPCYLFTWHAYGSWLPDRPQGFVHWNRGLQVTDVALARCYRKEQKQPQVELTPEIQVDLIHELDESTTPLSCRLHSVATDLSHLHVLVSWTDTREAKQLRRSLRRSMSSRLNQKSRQKWFSRGGDMRRVCSQSHYDYLVSHYLPTHKGWKWCETRGNYR